MAASNEAQAERTLPRACLIVAIAALVPYLLLPAQPVIYDGELAITANEAVRSGPLGGLVGVDFWGQPTHAEHSTRTWRPLVSLTWALQLRLFGASAAAIHLVDVLLHASASALVVLLVAAWRIDRSLWIPAGLLFALHPVQTDAVASAVGRADVLAGICLLGALVLQARAWAGERPAIARAAAVALLGAALLCKEYAVAFPFLFAGADLARAWTATPGGADRRGQLWSWGGAFALLAAYLVVRNALFGGLGGALANPDLHPLAGQSLVVRVATSLALIPLALRLLVLPFALNHHYRFGTLLIPESLLDPRSLWGLVLVTALVAGSIWVWRACRQALPAFALALVLLPLAPSLHIVSIVGVLFAERFLYVPVAGLTLAVAWAVERWTRSPATRRLATATLVAVSVVFAALAFERTRDWASMERLARSSLASYPGGSDVLKQLGVALLRDRRAAEALPELERAVEINPRDAQAWSVLADALAQAGRPAEAAEALRKVVALAPAEPGLILRALGEAELQAERAPAAIEPLTRAHELMPGDARTLHDLAQAHLRSGDPASAVRVLRAGELAMQTDPQSLRPLLGQAMLRLGQTRATEGRKEDAVYWTRQAIESGALPAAGVFLAGMVAREAGEADWSRQLFEQALALDPDLLRKKHEAALRLGASGSHDEAIALFREILIVEPEQVATLFNLGRALTLAGRPAEAIDPLERGLARQEDAEARALLEQARAGRGKS